MDGDQLLASGLPVTPAEFELLVKQQCAKTREFLKRTLVKAASAIVSPLTYYILSCYFVFNIKPQTKF